jgi:hypothetical protein
MIDSDTVQLICFAVALGAVAVILAAKFGRWATGKRSDRKKRGEEETQDELRKRFLRLGQELIADEARANEPGKRPDPDVIRELARRRANLEQACIARKVPLHIVRRSARSSLSGYSRTPGLDTIALEPIADVTLADPPKGFIAEAAARDVPLIPVDERLELEPETPRLTAILDDPFSDDHGKEIPVEVLPNLDDPELDEIEVVF